MTVTLALLAGAASIAWLAPGVLWRLHATRLNPVPLIVAWLATLVGVIATVAAGVVLLLVPGHGVGRAPMRLLGGCWPHLVHSASPPVEQTAGLLGSVVLAALGARLAMIARRQARGARGARRECLAVLRLAARTEHTCPPTLWLAHDRPLAFSMSGRPGCVVATEGLTRHLKPAQVRAVLEHERAHLRGCHHLIARAADVTAAALPFAPLLRQAPAAVGELIELAADVSAVRACGSTTLRAALLRVAGEPAPGTALGIGQAAVALRLTRLDREITPPGVLRSVASSIMSSTAVILPTVVAALLLVVTFLLFCPTS